MTVRLTQPAFKVLRFLLQRPREGCYGAEIVKVTKVGSGTLYPMLARLEAAGWLTSEWELTDPCLLGRPQRRIYRLTEAGWKLARSALGELQIA